jgi:hypothetical protein
MAGTREEEALVQQIAVEIEAGAREVARQMVDRIERDVPQLFEIGRSRSRRRRGRSRSRARSRARESRCPRF